MDDPCYAHWPRNLVLLAGTFQQWAHSSVHRLCHYLLEDKDSRECYDTLQGQYKPFKTELPKQARKDYLLHIAQANKWDKKVSLWTTRWQRLS